MEDMGERGEGAKANGDEEGGADKVGSKCLYC